MKHRKSDICKFIIMAFIVLAAGFIDYHQRRLFPSQYQLLISVTLMLAALITFLIFFHIWFYRPYASMLNKINKYYADILNETTVTDEYNNNLSIDDCINDLEVLISHYKSNQKQQSDLVNKLTSTNKVLDQNSKFANAIVQITSEILRSGDIHSILQLILNKAIEIIPNAQKGSILLYNHGFLEYKAMCGYDMEGLKGFKFNIDEIYQYNAKDLYEPIIIPDVEAFNQKLKKDKFNILKETRSFELKSSISCAISLDNQFYGTINIDNIDSNSAFLDEHKPIIKYFAEQIGIALKNAQLLEKILYLSQNDSLTNIYNRAYFEEQFCILHEECKQSSKPYALVSIDMNDLKIINDSYGHEAGDKLIITFTNYIAGIEPKPDIFARVGGDEFALIFKDKSKEEVLKIIQSIKDHFAAVPFRYDNQDVLNITFSYGICTYPEEAEDTAVLCRIADKLMYKDKRLSKKKTLQ